MPSGWQSLSPAPDSSSLPHEGLQIKCCLLRYRHKLKIKANPSIIQSERFPRGSPGVLGTHDDLLALRLLACVSRAVCVRAAGFTAPCKTHFTSLQTVPLQAGAQPGTELGFEPCLALSRVLWS